MVRLPDRSNEHALQRFSCEDIHARYTKLSGSILLTRATKRIKPFAQRHFYKTNLTQQLDEFSLRESSCNSASPKVDVASNRLRKFVSHNNVAIKESCSGLEDAKDFPICHGFVGHKVQHSIRNHDVHTLVFQGQ